MTREELLRVPYRKVTSRHMDALRALFGGKCKRCGGRWSLARRKVRGRKDELRHRPLEFAHIKPTRLSGRGRGLNRRFFDVLRNPDCYELLCKKCHWILDADRQADEWLAVAMRREAAVA